MELPDRQQEITRLENEIKDIDSQIASCGSKIQETDEIGIFLLRKLALALNEENPEKTDPVPDMMKITEAEDNEYRTKLKNFMAENTEGKNYTIRFGDNINSNKEEKKKLQRKRRRLVKQLNDLLSQ